MDEKVSPTQDLTGLDSPPTNPGSTGVSKRAAILVGALLLLLNLTSIGVILQLQQDNHRLEQVIQEQGLELESMPLTTDNQENSPSNLPATSPVLPTPTPVPPALAQNGDQPYDTRGWIESSFEPAGISFKHPSSLTPKIIQGKPGETGLALTDTPEAYLTFWHGPVDHRTDTEGFWMGLLRDEGIVFAGPCNRNQCFAVDINTKESVSFRLSSVIIGEKEATQMERLGPVNDGQVNLWWVLRTDPEKVIWIEMIKGDLVEAILATLKL